jgi:hypothetical protein
MRCPDDGPGPVCLADVAAKNYQELRSRQTAAVSRIARVAEVFLALGWPVILLIAGVLVVLGKS